MANEPVPPALKVFFWALAGAIGGTIGAHRAAGIIIERFFPGLDPVWTSVMLFLAPLAVGMASAVTAGVIAGKAQRS